MSRDSKFGDGAHNLDDYPCSFDGCDEAYPHSLLREKHMADEHPVPERGSHVR